MVTQYYDHTELSMPEDSARFEKILRRREGRMPVACHASSCRGAARRSRRSPRHVSQKINGAHRRFNKKFGRSRLLQFS